MDLLVSTQWLVEALAAPDMRPDLRVVDATLFLPGTPRDPHAEFVTAHIPGALFLDLVNLGDPGNPLPSMAPTDAQFAARMAVMGVSETDLIVVYDNSPTMTSGRGWWLFRLFGARRVAILDGGMQRWLAEGRPIEGGEGKSIAGSSFAPKRDENQIRSKADILANLSSCAAQIVDARSASRFRGEDPEPRPGMVSGHIPGSRSLPTGKLLDGQGLWKRGDMLRQTFMEAGVDLNRPLIATCGSGITACNLLFGAALLGKQDVTVYDGSWSEWGADPDTPKAAGPA